MPRWERDTSGVAQRVNHFAEVFSFIHLRFLHQPDLQHFLQEAEPPLIIFWDADLLDLLGDLEFGKVPRT